MRAVARLPRGRLGAAPQLGAAAHPVVGGVGRDDLRGAPHRRLRRRHLGDRRRGPRPLPGRVADRDRHVVDGRAVAHPVRRHLGRDGLRRTALRDGVRFLAPVGARTRGADLLLGGRRRGGVPPLPRGSGADGLGGAVDHRLVRGLPHDEPRQPAEDGEGLRRREWLGGGLRRGAGHRRRDARGGPTRQLHGAGPLGPVARAFVPGGAVPRRSGHRPAGRHVAHRRARHAPELVAGRAVAGVLKLRRVGRGLRLGPAQLLAAPARPRRRGPVLRGHAAGGRGRRRLELLPELLTGLGLRRLQPRLRRRHLRRDDGGALARRLGRDEPGGARCGQPRRRPRKLLASLGGGARRLRLARLRVEARLRVRHQLAPPGLAGRPGHGPAGDGGRPVAPGRVAPRTGSVGGEPHAGVGPPVRGAGVAIRGRGAGAR